MADPAPGILTIGHSNHPLESLLALLQQHQVAVVVDTRSSPYSKYSPQYDRQALQAALSRSGIRYVYLGDELGGRPEGPEFYDDEGHVLYYRVAESPKFLQGLARLEHQLREARAVMLCSEEDPAACHRRLLIGRVLAERGVQIDHIRGDGRLQSEAELTQEEAGDDGGQLSLFEHARIPEWKSIPSVSPKKRQSDSSPL